LNSDLNENGTLNVGDNSESSLQYRLTVVKGKMVSQANAESQLIDGRRRTVHGWDEISYN